MTTSPAMASRLARWRVPLGFATAALTLVFARPTTPSLGQGFLIAVLGEAIRVWAAGHLEKSREVTRSGPYRFMRHPLYVGSSVMAAGIVVAANSAVVGIAVPVYMFATIVAAVTTEEAFLRQAFGDTYDRYVASEATPMPRRFSVERAMRNREYRAVAGLVGGFVVLALRSYVHL